MMPTTADGPVVVCIIYGPVMRVDGTPCAYATVTFNSQVPQNIGGQVVQPIIVTSMTDAQGELVEVAMAQGMAVQIYVSDNGITYPPMAALIPNLPSASFSQVLNP